MDLLAPKTLFDMLAIISFLASAVTIFLSQIRRNDMQLLRDNNQDLRVAMDDANNKVKLMESKIGILSEKVLSLEKKNETLEGLVITALKQYFVENPNIAGHIKKEVMK